MLFQKKIHEPPYCLNSKKLNCIIHKYTHLFGKDNIFSITSLQYTYIYPISDVCLYLCKLNNYLYDAYVMEPKEYRFESKCMIISFKYQSYHINIQSNALYKLILRRLFKCTTTHYRNLFDSFV